MRLKSGESLQKVVSKNIELCKGSGNGLPLEFPELVATEFLPMLGDVDPERPMTTYRRGALNCEADDQWVFASRCQVDVFAGDIRRSVVPEWQ